MHVYGFMADYVKVNNINTSCSDQQLIQGWGNLL